MPKKEYFLENNLIRKCLLSQMESNSSSAAKKRLK